MVKSLSKFAFFLSKTIFEVINRGKDSKINYLKKKEFSHLGESSKIIVKILMRFFLNQTVYLLETGLLNKKLKFLILFIKN